MLKILPVYLLTALLCLDACISKFVRPRGARALSFRDDSPEEEATRTKYKSAPKRSLARTEACLPNPRAAAVRRRSEKMGRKTNGQGAHKCRTSRRAQSLHARHDDTKYGPAPFPPGYDYHDVDFGRAPALRKGRDRYNRKQRCNCRKKKHTICADVDYFHEVFTEFERLMRKFMLDREEREAGGIEGSSASKLKPPQVGKELGQIHPDMLADTKRAITNDERKNDEDHPKKPFLHV